VGSEKQWPVDSRQLTVDIVAAAPSIEFPALASLGGYCCAASGVAFMFVPDAAYGRVSSATGIFSGATLVDFGYLN